ncbi:hypothetical protein BG842_19055 [Haladaptatus sp. W1]|uniref:DUF7504 family protein n=1 Tax=Haladaptatus sp. W1 TaxID=1897478 RepID=UPI000849A22D|nr:hypothetical protein [Haladaptatus sp. W1]ODR82851.1 hypothetical protein BG842_19055 [Haladaptatus sp. W1]
MTNANLDFETGRCILVTTPASDDGRTGDHDFPALPYDETNALVAVTCDKSAESFLRTWRRSVGALPDRVRLVEVGGAIPSTEDGSSAERTVQAAVEAVHRPNDLDGILSAVASALAANDGETTVVFDSLTTAFEHVSPREIIPFFDAVSERLADANAVGYFCYHGAADDSEIAPLRVFADEMVEVTDEGDRDVRSSATMVRDGPSLDGMFEALGSRRRRDALRYLLDTDGGVAIDELATAVARREIGEEELESTQHRQYYSTLYQLHLPKLDSAGLIDYDERGHRVSALDGARWAASFLALVEE